MEINQLRTLTNRLVAVRTQLLKTHPFFGRLLLRLKLGYAKCETAFTDMKNIVFDPDFASKLSDNEIIFVYLHEIMHCVLHHCTRGRSLRPHLYNIACDIVVNSLIMESIGAKVFKIDNVETMHLVPNGSEGRLYTAEEVYEMLLKAPEEQIKERYGDTGFDTHIIWEQIVDSLTDDEWDQYIKEAALKAGANSGIPYGLQRYLAEISHTPKTNWRQILHDFIQYDKSDYSFQIPDRRFQDEYIFPSFQEKICDERVENLWFVVDTSGSVTNDALAEAFNEIKDALSQINNLSGYLSFFDSEISEPVAFDSINQLNRINPIGGGGTSFETIFTHINSFFEDDIPTEIIILTDGFASFPSEKEALDIPVMWIIIDSDIDAPWGESVHIES